MYLPNMANLYGSDFREISIGGVKSYSAQIDLSKVHLSSLDQSTARCDMSTVVSDTSSCITNFIEMHAGCKFPFYKSSSANNTCSEWSQFEKLLSLTKKLQDAGATEMYKLTGCLSACEKDKYYMGKPVQQTPESLV